MRVDAYAFSRIEPVTQKSSIAASIGGHATRQSKKEFHRVSLTIGGRRFISEKKYASFQTANAAAQSINKSQGDKT